MYKPVVLSGRRTLKLLFLYFCVTIKTIIQTRSPYPFGAIVGSHFVYELQRDQDGADDPYGEQQRGDFRDGQFGVALGRQAQPDVVFGGHRGHGQHGDQTAQDRQEPLELAHRRRVL